MEGTMPTCYSGGDVWNIQVPFGIAVTDITSTLIKGVGIQHSREEKTKSLKDIKKEKKMTEVLKTAQIEPLTKSFVTQTGLETTKFCITIHWEETVFETTSYRMKRFLIDA